MSNSKLIGKVFPVPDKVLRELGKNLKKFSDKRESKGFNRSIFILERRSCSYEQLKRIKNYFDYVTEDNYDEVEYLLNGGDVMKKWVNYTLDQARNSVHGTKSAKKNAGMSNQFRSDAKDNLTPVTPKIKSTPEFMSTSDLMEEVDKIKTIYKKLN
jgi:hypothetical protein